MVIEWDRLRKSDGFQLVILLKIPMDDETEPPGAPYSDGRATKPKKVWEQILLELSTLFFSTISRKKSFRRISEHVFLTNKQTQCIWSWMSTTDVDRSPNHVGGDCSSCFSRYVTVNNEPPSPFFADIHSSLRHVVSPCCCCCRRFLSLFLVGEISMSCWWRPYGIIEYRCHRWQWQWQIYGILWQFFT